MQTLPDIFIKADTDTQVFSGDAKDYMLQNKGTRDIYLRSEASTDYQGLVLKPGKILKFNTDVLHVIVRGGTGVLSVAG